MNPDPMLRQMRLRLWLAAALPAVLVMLVLLVLFVQRHSFELLQAQQHQAQAVAKQLASQAEFALFAADVQTLQRLAGATKDSDDDLVAVALRAANGHFQAGAGRFGAQLPDFSGNRVHLNGDRLWVIYEVRSQLMAVDDPLAAGLLESGVAESVVLGYVALEYDLSALQRSSRQLLLWALAATGLALVLAALLSALIASSVTRPVAHISDVVRRIGGGQLQARADVERCGPMAQLASGINRMASQVAVTQEELMQQVQQATDELRLQKLEAERTARTDGLTGLLRRRAFIELAEAEIQRSLRYEDPLSFIMFDVDHFKFINDNHGHPCGDAALVHLAELLREQMRDSDLPCRWGGEEFVVLLPRTSADVARHAAERIRSHFEANPVRWKDRSLRVTASFGVAAFDARDISLSSMVARADTALYRAKRNGRNRVEVAEGGFAAGLEQPTA
ncbi:GGDEF domain protein [Serpentinimonas maccroryi]|uniref:diguanylate cyclase n=1 Tax=Serpentinimonas maccroryi TaxID=1458426 RepID=A0A060NL02_9BURK|nr:GGDEF domain-containing protein [Serpentinimonas maccroryi]MCM2479393.1 diguanylate cyclase [Serpentinimonas maccroryi]BAO82397.1 GGDEF domain protein [Serpentinimonas maccroryi]